MTAPLRATPRLRLLLLSGCAHAIHGYHLGADDAAIYVPGIKRAFDPELYGFGSQFFMMHARLSLFPTLVGGTARVAHVPIDAAILACHFLGLFLLLWGAWQLLTVCFNSNVARWGGVALLAGTLGVPVAGTALVLADPYVTARTLSTPFTLFCIAAFLSNRWRAALAWLIATTLVHPQMGTYCGAFLITLAVLRNTRRESVMPLPLAAAGLPMMFDFHPSLGAAREALYSRTFFFVYNWAWYEWLGVFAPLALTAWVARIRLRATTAEFVLLVRTLVPFGLVFTALGLLLSSSVHLENFVRLQPMRAFHLIYVVFFILLGGLLGEYLLKSATWRWAVLFIPLAGGMFFADRDTYPASPHVEWPGVGQSSPWLSAFYWIRANTPKDALFAVGSDYMRSREEEAHGFRAVAERSMLADNVKDSGAVSLFPELAAEWKEQSRAQDGWEEFGPAQYSGLARRYGVNWVVARKSATAGLSCPYRNLELAVCQVGPEPLAPGASRLNMAVATTAPGPVPGQRPSRDKAFE